MLTKTEEIVLIKEALDGSQKAFKTLYLDQVEGLFRFLNQFSTDREKVQDWTQRTFIKAFDKLSSFEMNSRFKTWLFAIGINEMRTDMRSIIQFEELPEDFDEQETEETETELLKWIKAKEAIKSLPPENRMILLLHIAEGYSHREIGEMLSIKEGASRIILHRAKQKLRNQLIV